MTTVTTTPPTTATTTTAPADHILWITTTTGRVAYRIDTRIMRQAMIRAGKRRVDLARSAHLSQSMIGDIVAGRRQPSERSLWAIAEALDVAPLTLILRASSALRSASIQTKETTAP